MPDSTKENENQKTTSPETLPSKAVTNKVDDEEFAHCEAEKLGKGIMQRFRSKSCQWIKLKMLQKGIAADVANKLLANGESHDRELALCLSQKQMPRIKVAHPQQRAVKLAGYLLRKGFDADLCWEIASLQEEFE
ncbi:RecX family transcriptional regulator [Piscirickettsia salmonis]|uniref:RecX family transcriptional regulator n=1 Tax=Piscirickettsia salmonis TaxID=1238 RepID=UPI0012BAF384|nr:RecX family transcriptional regulator [Piscirickettsia salmonis]QGP57110.1 recombination regulator RecX [Piscirickettsia salmonis]QGP61908.1 recombination regulator RecX [Piscirickettsia salmonis]